MNYREKVYQILVASSSAYRAGRIDRYQMQNIQGRCRTIFRVLRHRDEYRLRRVVDETYIRSRFLPLRDIFARGGIVTAFDVGFQPYSSDGVINPLRATEEIGISTLEQGSISTTTYRLHSRAGRLKDALYGPIIYTDLPTMLGIAKTAYERADAILFHDAREDAPRLSICDSARCVDTLVLEKILRDWRRDPSLEAVCEHYCPQMNSDHPHESGNDAYRTLKVAEAMTVQHSGSLDKIMKDRLRSERKSLFTIRENSKQAKRIREHKERLRRSNLIFELRKTGRL